MPHLGSLLGAQFCVTWSAVIKDPGEVNSQACQDAVSWLIESSTGLLLPLWLGNSWESGRGSGGGRGWQTLGGVRVGVPGAFGFRSDGGGDCREENRWHCGVPASLYHSAITREHPPLIRHSGRCWWESSEQSRQTPQPAGSRRSSGRRKTAKRRRNIRISDKCWGGLEMMQGEKWKIGKWETRSVKCRYLFDGGIHYTVFEHV